MQHKALDTQIVTLSPALTVHNQHATARVLREIEPHSESPTRVEGSKSPLLDASTPGKPRSRRISGWAREVAALNGNVTQLGPLEILKDSRIHVTRRTLKVVTELAANREPLPQKSLDVILLAGDSATPLADETGNGDEGSQYEGSSQSTISNDIEVPPTPNRDLSYSLHEYQVIGPHKNQIRGPLPIIPKLPSTAYFSSEGVLKAEVLVQGPLQWEEWHEQKSKSKNPNRLHAVAKILAVTLGLFERRSCSFDR